MWVREHVHCNVQYTVLYMGESTGWEETGMSSLFNLGWYPYGILSRDE